LARKAFKENRGLWPSYNAVYCGVRYVLGSIGGEHRKDIADTSQFREPRGFSVDYFEDIPDGIQEIKDWDLYRVNGPFKALVFSDVHIPFHDSALRVALRRGKDEGCNLVLMNGDIVDCHQLSKFLKDPRQRTFAEEIRTMRLLLDSLRKEFGKKARIIYKLGNHEERYIHFLIRQCPVFLDIPEFDFKEIMHLDKYGVELVSDHRPVTLGKLNVVHGHEYSINSAVNPARGIFLRAKAHCMVSHLHKTSAHSDPTVEQTLISTWSIGCLCHDEKTEVLTSNGWVPFPQLTENHSVAEFNRDSLIINRRPLAIQRLQYSGEMVHFRGARVDMLVTPEHKMVYSRSTSDFRVAPAAYVGSLVKPHIPIAGYSVQSSEVTLDQAAVIAWVVTEGSVEKRGKWGRVTVYQKKPETCKIIRADLAAAGLRWTEVADRRSGVIAFRLPAESSYTVMEWMDGNPKRLPRRLLNSGFHVLKRAYETLILGDGHRNPHGTDYFATIFDSLADDFQELCAKIGYSCRFKIDERPTNLKANSRIIRCLVRKFQQAEATHCERVQYAGMVYDVTTTSGFFMVRRNGLVCASGNCDIHPQYRPISGWNHGFAIVDVAADGGFEVQNFKILKGKAFRA